RGSVPVYSVPDWKIIASLPASTNLATYHATWSSNGRYIGVKRQAGTARQGLLELWEIGSDDPKPRLIRTTDLRYRAFSFHPAQPLAMVGGMDGPVTVWNLESATAQREFRLPDRLHALEYSPDGSQFAACYKWNTNWAVACYDTDT